MSNDNLNSVQQKQAGRPLLFESNEDLQIRIEQYFTDCDTELDTRRFSHDTFELDEDTKRQVCVNCGRTKRSRGCMLVEGKLKKRRPYTVSGLADWLKTSRHTLINYSEREEYFHTVMEAKSRIERYGEECLYDKEVPTAGVKFSLSNNYGWADKIETKMEDLREDPAKRLIDALLPHAPVPPIDQGAEAGAE